MDERHTVTEQREQDAPGLGAEVIAHEQEGEWLEEMDRF